MIKGNIKNMIKNIDPKKIYGTKDVADIFQVNSRNAAKYIIQTKFSAKDRAIIGGSPEFPRFGVYGKSLIEYLESFPE